MGKRLMYFFLLVLALSACSHKAYQGIETTTDTVITDSVQIEYRDRIIKVPVPMDSVRVDTVIKIITVKETPQIQDLYIKGVNGIVGVEAWLKNNHLSALGYVRDSSIYYTADSLEKVITHLRTENTTTITKEKVVIVKKRITTIGWIGIIFLLVTILYFLNKVFKPDLTKLFSSLFK